MALPTLAVERSIDFEDRPAANDSRVILSDEYASLGAHFVGTDDGATWGGIGAGDPGAWQIEGTQGSTFLGFDGQSYEMALEFDSPVEAFQLDVSLAAGPRFQFDFFELRGFLEGVEVGSSMVFFQDINRWQTVSLPGPVDRVVWFGTGRPGRRYGVDHLRWIGLGPQLLEVEIDIRPRSTENRIWLGRWSFVPVVLYGAPDFAVEDVNVDTLAFGPAGAGVAHRRGPRYVDLDGDGLLDMLARFRIRDTGISLEDTEACLRGETLDGSTFEGCDLVAPKAKRPWRTQLRDWISKRRTRSAR